MIDATLNDNALTAREDTIEWQQWLEAYDKGYWPDEAPGEYDPCPGDYWPTPEEEAWFAEELSRAELPGSDLDGLTAADWLAIHAAGWHAYSEAAREGDDVMDAAAARDEAEARATREAIERRSR